MIIPKFGMFCVSNFLPQRNFTDKYIQESSNIANKTIYNKFNERLQAIKSICLIRFMLK